MNKRHLLAIDQGTTSSRAVLFDRSAQMLHIAQKELPQHYPKTAWVEHDANDIWNDTLEVTKQAIKVAGGTKNISAIGITNQRETTILWNSDTGKPIHNAIVWQDRRTANFCEDLKQKGYTQYIALKTGLLPDPYFSATKIRWILKNIPSAQDLLNQGKLLFGTVDSFLLWKLTEGKNHYTDYTNASRTGLFNINTHCWDDDLLQLYDIPKSILPEVKDNVDDFGETAPHLFGAPIKIGGMAGDQHAAFIGQCCFEEGMIKSTYGTGCFALMNIGQKFSPSKNKLLTTPAYRLSGKTTYAIEGSIYMAGAIIQWLRDGLKIIKTAPETEQLATSIIDNEGVYLIPAFTGLGAPHWVPEASASIVGLTRNSGKAHFARAALEAQAYQTMDLLSAIEKDSGIKPKHFRVDGGLVENEFMCQFLADITHCTIDVPKNTETTALGAAFLAGLSCGIYNDLQDLSNIWTLKRQYKKKLRTDKSNQYYNEWTEHIEHLKKAWI